MISPSAEGVVMETPPGLITSARAIFWWNTEQEKYTTGEVNTELHSGAVCCCFACNLTC